MFAQFFFLFHFRFFGSVVRLYAANGVSVEEKRRKTKTYINFDGCCMCPRVRYFIGAVTFLVCGCGCIILFDFGARCHFWIFNTFAPKSFCIHIRIYITIQIETHAYAKSCCRHCHTCVNESHACDSIGKAFIRTTDKLRFGVNALLQSYMISITFISIEQMCRRRRCRRLRLHPNQRNKFIIFSSSSLSFFFAYVFVSNRCLLRLSTRVSDMFRHRCITASRGKLGIHSQSGIFCWVCADWRWRRWTGRSKVFCMFCERGLIEWLLNENTRRRRCEP